MYLLGKTSNGLQYKNVETGKTTKIESSKAKEIIDLYPELQKEGPRTVKVDHIDFMDEHPLTLDKKHSITAEELSLQVDKSINHIKKVSEETAKNDNEPRDLDCPTIEELFN